MNLFTDAVDRKTPYPAIKSNLRKKSQEYRVLATLRYLMPIKFDNMIVADRPDLQDKEGSVGIEVTVATNQKDLVASGVFSEYCKKPNSDKSKKQKESIESKGYSIYQCKAGRVLESPLGSENDEKRAIQNRIANKSKKVVDYRKWFSSVGLALLFVDPPTSQAENNLEKWIFDIIEKNNPAFDFIFAISERFCYYFDLLDKQSSKYEIPRDIHLRLQKIGRMTAEGELTIESMEWQ